MNSKGNKIAIDKEDSICPDCNQVMTIKWPKKELETIAKINLENGFIMEITEPIFTECSCKS